MRSPDIETLNFWRSKVVARKTVATAEAVIRYFLSNATDREATFRMARTILESQGLVTGRKTTKRVKAVAVGTTNS